MEPTGAGPTGRILGDSSEWTVWTTPGDDSTAVGAAAATASRSAPPVSALTTQDAGLSFPDGPHHGILTEFPFTPETLAPLRAALTS